MSKKAQDVLVQRNVYRPLAANPTTKQKKINSSTYLGLPIHKEDYWISLIKDYIQQGQTSKIHKGHTP